MQPQEVSTKPYPRPVCAAIRQVSHCPPNNVEYYAYFDTTVNQLLNLLIQGPGAKF